ncbi:hypothetical protein AYO04_17380 [Raoultella planticola]|nr:hypothetical protein AYO04_17380 [Raoultella planticola]
MAGLRHWQRLSPGGALLTGATAGAVFGFCRPERCLGRLMAGLRHWQRLSPGGALLTGATAGAVFGFAARSDALGG